MGPGWPMLANMGEPIEEEAAEPPLDGPAWPFAASKAALYEEAGAKEAIDCERKGELERGPNEGGELMEEPKEALKGEWEPAPIPWLGAAWPNCCGGGGPCWACCCGCCCCCWKEPKGNEGEIEKVEPPKLNEGPDWPEKRLCDGIDWLALNCSKGDWAGCCCGCACCCCGGLNRLFFWILYF